MANTSPVDSFWATFTRKKILYRNISLLGLIMFPGTYQMLLVQFLVEEQARVHCNRSGNCHDGDRVETIPSNATPASYPEIHRGKVSYGVEFTLYLSLFLGSVLIGLVADFYGRLNAIFPFLAIVFIGSLTSAFFFKALTIFIVLRCIAGFGSGGALHVLFVLAAEYVDPAQRPLVIFTLWTNVAIAVISLSGIAFIIESRKILILTMTLPLLLVVLLWKVIPESPRWVLLNATRSEESEAQGLLHRDGNQQQNRRYSLFWTKWERFHSATKRAKNDGCYTFLRRKEPRKITIVVGFTWFSIGMLYRGLNTSSIQLLSSFYGNYAVRQLVNFLGYAVFFVMVTWTGRRFATVMAMIFGSFVCIIFSVSSQGFLLAEYKTVAIVIQFVGRMLVMVAISSLGLYSMELFPTVVRCSAVGLVIGIAYIGSAITPLIMTLQRFHPVVPLGVMGCFSLIAGILCHCLLPRTKGTMTSETFDDISYPKMYFSQKSWSPKAYRRRRNDPENESQSVDSGNPIDDSIDPDYNDDYPGLGKSWEVSFDRASRTSKWEMLSYDDARRTPRDQHNCIDEIIHEDSNLLSDKDIEKMAHYVPSFTWVLVYSTFNHGMSLKTLYHRLREIESPVLLVVKDSNGFVFGVMSPVPPHLGPNFCGFGKSFFFTCKPNFKVYPCSGKNAYYMTGDSTGLAFGCSEGMFGLWLDNDLYRGRSTACDTYNSEMLSATEDFVCHGVEAWTFS